MSDKQSRSCVLLPCSAKRSWVIPQRCLGEIVTIPAQDNQPPDEINWRGETVPVLDFGRDGPIPWCDPRAVSGLVAVVLGQRGETSPYFGIAVRGEGLGVSPLPEGEIEDLPDEVLDYATAAFRMGGRVYQVPDILALQRAVGAGSTTFLE